MEVFNFENLLLILFYYVFDKFFKVSAIPQISDNMNSYIILIKMFGSGS